jgi:hypothetical protein
MSRGKSGGRHNKLPERQEEPMKARIIPIDDPARLSDEQKARIIATAYAGPKSFVWRANELKNIGYCTDDVKFQVLKESRLISGELYDCIYDIYFGNVRTDAEVFEPKLLDIAEYQNTVVAKNETTTNADTPTDMPTETPTADQPEKRAYAQRMTDEETVELINFYLDGASYEDLAQRYGRTVAQIKAKLRDEKSKGKHRDMFNDKTIPTVDLPSAEPEELTDITAAVVEEHSVPKAVRASGRGFLTTDGGLKINEEPLTTAIRQKLIELGIVQMYAQVEITVRPSEPEGMVVSVEE